MNLFELFDSFPTDDACREHLERIRWPDGVRCPRCQSDKTARLRKRKQFTCKANGCNYRFSVTTDTVMHASKIPLRKWFAAIYILSDAKKSVSSLQLSRELGVSGECAWHLTMRIREAMREDHDGLFRGICQADEYYHGGLPRKGTGPHKRGRGTARQPIIGVVEKSTGRVRTAVIKDGASQTLVDTLSQWLKLSGVELHTDEWMGYRKLGRLCRVHRVVNHKIEYVAADGTNTNGIENAWSLFARATIGSFHKISTKHLSKYLGEFDARYNARRENGTFFPRILRQCAGRRLSMKELVNAG